MILLVALIAIAIDLNVVCSVCGVGSVLLVVVVLFFLTKELDYRAKRGCPVPLEASPWLYIILLIPTLGTTHNTPTTSINAS